MEQFKTVMSLIFSLVGVGIVLYLCYWVSRFASKKMGTTSKFNRNMKVIERIALTQDKGMAIVEVCSKYYLVGFSNNSVEILKEFDPEDNGIVLPENTGGNADFLNFFQNAIKNRKGNGKDV